MKNFFSSIKDKRISQALIYSMVDGVLWAMMFGFAENYIIPFALFFHASALQVSLMQGSMQFGISMAQLAGASLIQKFRKRKTLSICCNILHATSYLVIIYGGVISRNPLVILLAYAIGAFANNIAGPGWTSWMNDIVPAASRGTFWGLRNRLINLTQFCAIVFAGILLQIGQSNNCVIWFYIPLFTLASFFRYSSVVPLYKQYEPEMAVSGDEKEFKFRIFLAGMLKTNFGRFALFSFLLTFSVNTMSTLVSVFLIQSLHYNYIPYTIVMLSSMVTTFIAMSYWGPLSDRYGNYRILLVTAISLPLISFGWAFIKNFYLFILLQLFSGFVWSGFNLSTMNYIFDSIKPVNIPKISAYFNSLNNLCAFAGSLAGGLLTLVVKDISLPIFAHGSYELIFIFSGVLRFLCVIIMIRQFGEVRKVAPSPGIRHFYIYKPMANAINKFQLILDRLGIKKDE